MNDAAIRAGTVFLVAGFAALLAFWLAPKGSKLEAWAGAVTASAAVGLALSAIVVAL